MTDKVRKKSQCKILLYTLLMEKGNIICFQNLLFIYWCNPANWLFIISLSDLYFSSISLSLLYNKKTICINILLLLTNLKIIIFPDTIKSYQQKSWWPLSWGTVWMHGACQKYIMSFLSLSLSLKEAHPGDLLTWYQMMDTDSHW